MTKNGNNHFSYALNAQNQKEKPEQNKVFNRRKKVGFQSTKS